MKLFERIKKSIGPGVITGIADDDPSGIATYAQTGAMFGLGQIWLALFSYPFMLVIQEMCGRIGMITGKGLAGVLRLHYSKKVLFGSIALLTIANTINIGADLSAMAEAIQLIIPAPYAIALAGITIITILAEVLIPYKIYVSILKYLALTVFAYVVAAFYVHMNWIETLMALFTPHFEWNATYILNITAMLGTTISPYLFFWQADEEVEEEVEHHKLRVMGKGVPRLHKGDLAQMRIDTAIGMFVSNLITFFIIATTSATLSGQTVTSAAQVAEALRPLAGDLAFALFALGIIGTGMLAVPVLAGSAAYALSEAFGWSEGLGKTFRQAKAFYMVIILSTAVGLLVNFTSIAPITLLYYAAILNGLLAPPLMILIIMIGNNKKILGEKTNGKTGNILGIIITTIMSALTLYFLYSLF